MQDMDAAVAEATSAAGRMSGVLRINAAQPVKYLRKQLMRGNEWTLVLAGAQLERDALLEDLIDAAFVQAMQLDAGLPP